MSRYFEFKDEKSNKFWSVSSSDKKMSIHYGKIGTAGQKLDKEFESAEEAVKETEKAISKKLKEGYIEGNLTSSISPQIVIQVNEIAKSPKNPNLTIASSIDTPSVKLKELAKESIDLARLVAANTGASEELLLELARHSDEGVRRRIASNPSAPAKAAMDAGSQFPEDLLNNPSFDLYILAEPNLLQGIGASALRSLLKREACPESFFAYAASQDNEATQLAVLTNSRAPISVVQSLLASRYPRVKETAAKHSALQSLSSSVGSNWQDEFTAELLVEEKNRDKLPEVHKSLAYLLLSEVDDFSSLSEAERWVIRTAWTKEERQESFWMPEFSLDDEKCPASILEFAAKDADKDVRTKVAGNLGLPKHLQELLIEDSEKDVLEALANNENIDSSIMVKLARYPDSDIDEALSKDADSIVKAGIASNSETPKNILDDLAKDKAITIRRNVASNPNASLEALQSLSKDKDKQIKIGILKNPSAPENLKNEIFATFSKELKRDDIYELSQSSHLSLEIVRNLAENTDEAIRKNIAWSQDTVDILIQLSKDKSSDVRRAIASNEHSTQEILQVLSKDKNNNVRANVVSNPNCSVDILDKLSNDESTYVLGCVIGNSNTPIELIKKLVYHKDEDVRTSVAQNSRGDIEILKILVKDSESYVRKTIANPDNSDDESSNKIPVEILEILAVDEEADVRAAVAENINTPAELLSQLSKDKNLDRYCSYKAITAVVNNPNTPKEALEYLASIYINWLYKNEIPQSVQPADLRKIMEDSYDLESGLQDRVESAKKSKDLSGLRNEFIGRMVAGSKPSVSRCVAFLLSDCPPASLAKYQRSSWWIERCAIAQNQNVPDSVLKQLFKDSNLSVQDSASSRSGNETKALPLPKETGESLVKNNAVVVSDNNWEVDFNRALESKDTSLVGEVDKAVLMSFERLAYLFWNKIRLGKSITTDEMQFINGSEKAHSSSIAINTGTSTEMLDELINSSSWVVLCSIASNENTSVNIFEKLLKNPNFTHLYYIAENINTPLKILEFLMSELERLKGDDTYKITRQMTAEKIARNPNCSTELLEKLTHLKFEVGVREAIADNAKTSPDVLKALAEDENDYVKRSVASNENTPSEILRKMAVNENSKLRFLVAKNRKTPKDILENLYKDDEDTVREYVAANINTPIHVLEILAKDDKSDVLLAIAANPNTPKTILKNLLSLKDRNINGALVRNPNIESDLLESILQMEGDDVLRDILRHPNLSISLFETLSSALEGWGLYNLASSEDLSVEKLTILSKHKHENGPAGIANNLNLTLSLMSDLAANKNEEVRSELAQNPKLTPDLIKLLSADKSKQVQSRVAENLSTPIEILVSLSKEKDKDGDIKGALASNPNTPPAILEELMNFAQLRCAIAHNPSTPKNVLEELAIDDDPCVRSFIARNKNTPADTLRALMLEPYVEKDDDKDKILAAFSSPDALSELRAEYLKKLCAGLKPSYERVYGLLLSDCPSTALTKCAKSALWLERCAVAQNPSTPAKLMQALGSDSNSVVCGAAQR
jgi:predicted DNA-binding WGR domain protein